MKYFSTGILIIGIYLAACNNNSGPAEMANKDTAENSGAPATEDEKSETAWVRNAFPALFQYLAAKDSSFSPDKFRLSETALVDSLPAAALDKRIEPFYPYLLFNKDSSLAIDLYSYNYVLTDRKGKKQMEAGGPDTEVAVIDFRKKTRQRVLFSGPSIAVMDAQWKNGNEILIAGAEETANGIKPLIWLVNYPQHSLQLYTYPDTLQVDPNSFIEEKISNRMKVF